MTRPLLSPLVALFTGFDPVGLDGLIAVGTIVVGWSVFRETGRGRSSGEVRRARRQTTTVMQRVPALARATVGLTVAAVGAWSLPGTTQLLFAAVLLTTGSLLLASFLNERGLPDIDDSRPVSAGWVDRLPPEQRLLPPAILTAIVFIANRNRPLAEGRGDLVVVWILAIALAVIAVLPLGPRPAGPGAPRSWRRLVEPAAMALIVLVALILRVWHGDSYPWAVFQDEGVFGNAAKDVASGVLKNPWQTGWQAQPTLLWFLQSATMRVVGFTIAGNRLTAGIIGTAGVLFTLLYARRMFGPVAGYTAGLLMATFHASLYWSRVGLNTVGDLLFMPLILWLLDRGLFARRRLESLLAGVSIGLAQYFYHGARVFVLIAAGIMLYGLVSAYRDRGHVVDSVKSYVRVAWLAPAGTVLTFAPLGAYAIDHWAEYTARIQIVSVFSSGWLDRHMAETGLTEREVLIPRFFDALFVLVRGATEGFFRPGEPFAGTPLVIPVAVGLAIAVVQAYRRRYVALVLCLILDVFFLTLTEGRAFQTSRYIVLVPVAAIATGIFFDAVWRLLRAATGGRLIATAIVASAVLYVSVWHAHFYFRSPYQFNLYSDPNTEVSTNLAREIKPMGDTVTVYFFGAPRIYYHGMPQISFISPAAMGIDILEPIRAGDDPALHDPPIAVTELTLFIVLPERVEELGVIQRWFPGGTIREVSNQIGFLYYEYRVDPTG